MKDSKNLVIGMLCAVVCIMAVAYAAFSTQLNINGTASISSSWGVRIQDGPSCVFKAANEEEASAKACTGTSDAMCASVEKKSDSLATVTMVFQQPGDTATCTIKYENYGSLDANLTHVITGTTDTKAIKWTLDGVEGTHVLSAATADNNDDLHTVTVTAEFVDVDENEDGNSDVLESADKTATLSIVSTATQKLGR